MKIELKDFWLDLVALGIGHLVGSQLLHHGLGDLVVGAGPDVDHLVVAFAVGDQTGGILLLDLLHLPLGRGKDLHLRLRHDHVVDADRDAGARRIMEARVHQLVGEHDRFLEPHRAVALVDRRGNDFLRHVLVDQVERQTLGQDLRHQRTARRGFDHADVLHQLPISVADVFRRGAPAPWPADPVAALVGAMHFSDVGECHALAFGADAFRGSCSTDPSTTSCDGTMMGSPLAGERMLLDDIINARASSWASMDSGTWTAIWSPSKSALNAVQTSGCSWIALPSISTGSKAWMPRRCRVGARFRSTGCSRITSSRMSHTSGPSRSTMRFAALMVEASPRSCSLGR